MSRITMKTVVAAIILAGAGLSLAGCITVLPKVKPAQLYRFGFTPKALDTTAASPLPAGDDIGMSFGSAVFPQDSSGDRILTVEGSEVSYVAEARWTAPAQSLFNDAVSEGFARASQHIRLEPRGPGSARFRLDIAVRKFESDYSHGRPTVSIALDARIIRMSDRSVMAQRYITADVATKHNDMSMMADSYNEATTQVVGALIGFSEETLKGQEAPQTPAGDMPKASDKQKAEGL